MENFPFLICHFSFFIAGTSDRRRQAAGAEAGGRRQAAGAGAANASNALSASLAFSSSMKNEK
jgi:hypothetical protein